MKTHLWHIAWFLATMILTVGIVGRYVFGYTDHDVVGGAILFAMFYWFWAFVHYWLDKNKR